MEARNEQRRSVVASGKSVEDAVANGLKMLEVRRDQVDIEVLGEGSRGVLGFGAEDARVRLLVKLPPEPRSEAPVPQPAQQEKVELVSRPLGGDDQAASSEPLQVGREILSDLLRHMGVQAQVESMFGGELAEEGEPPPPVLNVTGADLGILIGRRGDTLRALQYLVRLMVSHRLKHWTNLVVDVEHYRVRRRRALDSLANRVADEVSRSGQSQALEPMPAYDRRLVHIALRNHPKVGTQSVGEGEKRKVTVVPKH
ncbi:RNA-binding cell elongation regulator Jag/EloR [Chloroflexota bacterium]